MTSKKTPRARNWTFVFYPDSAPANWEEIISGWQAEAYVSPLHDRDVNGDGSMKKPHYHVLVCFSGNKSVGQVQALSDQLSGIKIIPEHNQVADKRITARYLVHYDNPEKASYDVGDIREFGGADRLQFFNGDKEDETATIEMMAFCREQGIISFSTLADYAAEHRPEWFRVLVTKRAYFMDKYIKSLAYELTKGK